MFASKITSTIDVGDVKVTIRKLSWKKLREASEANTEHALATAKNVGPEMIRAFKEMDAAGIEAKPTKQDRYKGYDREKVLLSGIAGWSLQDVKVTPETVGDLETDAADVIFRAIIDLSVPEKEVAEAHRGES